MNEDEEFIGQPMKEIWEEPVKVRVCAYVCASSMLTHAHTHIHTLIVSFFLSVWVVCAHAITSCTHTHAHKGMYSILAKESLQIHIRTHTKKDLPTHVLTQKKKATHKALTVSFQKKFCTPTYARSHAHTHNNVLLDFTGKILIPKPCTLNSVPPDFTRIGMFRNIV